MNVCTMIATAVRISGSASRGAEWVTVDEAAIGYDHATRLWAEHALRIDLIGGGRTATAVELDLESARALRERLDEVIARAEASGV